MSDEQSWANNTYDIYEEVKRLSESQSKQGELLQKLLQALRKKLPLEEWPEGEDD